MITELTRRKTSTHEADDCDHNEISIKPTYISLLHGYTWHYKYNFCGGVQLADRSSVNRKGGGGPLSTKGEGVPDKCQTHNK